MVHFEGDDYPLKEIASISRKDPKKAVIDASAFPQASVNIMKALRDSGMNLNPQQDGLTIFVPIPKLTKEYRETLVAGSRKKMTGCKEDLRKVQNRYTKKVGEKDLTGAVTKDELRASTDVIKLVTDHFMSKAEQLHNAKAKEILGK